MLRLMRKRFTYFYFADIVLIILLTLFSSEIIAQCSSPINSFPYSEDFESSNGNWIVGGQSSDWTWGKPNKAVITAAASGNNCWMTGGLNSNGYANNEQAWIQSPCFDFSSLKNPSIQFDVFWETEAKYDGASLQYSTDKGNTWQTLGSYADNNCGNANWFNYQDIVYMAGGTSSAGWSGNIQRPSGNCQVGGGSGKWLTAKHSLSSLAGQPIVIFRFMFVAGSTCNDFDGFAIDDVSINDAPINITLNTQTKNLSCNSVSDGSIIIAASGGTMPYKYAWSPNVSSTSTASNLDTNKYTITVSDNNNCQATTTVIITEPTAINAAISTVNTSCQLNDGSATATITGGALPYTYSWNTIHVPDTVSLGNTGSASQVTKLIPGNYILKIKDADGCSFISPAFIITQQPPLQISLGADTVICPGGQIVISPGNFQSYLWQDNSINAAYTVTMPGTYSVKVTDDNDCKASATINVTAGDCSGIYFPSAFTPNGDGLNDQFGMIGKIGPIKDYHLVIYNRWGQIVFESFIPSEKWNGKVKDFATGNTTFVWEATFTVNNQKMSLKGSVVVID
jgi:gliding motility-associated-like protein